MKTQVIARATIAASPPAVFRYITNLKYHYLWNPNLQRVSPLQVLKLESSYKSVSLMLGIPVTGVNKVVKLVEDKELELRNQSGLIRYRVNYRLRAEGQRTIVTCTTVLTSDSAMLALTGSVLKLLAKRELQSDLKALKRAVEHDVR